jgi:hypothetical protein
VLKSDAQADGSDRFYDEQLQSDGWYAQLPQNAA